LIKTTLKIAESNLRNIPIFSLMH